MRRPRPRGLVAGINAARKVQGKEPVILDRASSYIGTLIDDLITKGASDPYRMMTSPLGVPAGAAPGQRRPAPDSPGLGDRAHLGETVGEIPGEGGPEGGGAKERRAEYGVLPHRGAEPYSCFTWNIPGEHRGQAGGFAAAAPDYLPGPGAHRHRPAGLPARGVRGGGDRSQIRGVHQAPAGGY